MDGWIVSRPNTENVWRDGDQIRGIVRRLKRKVGKGIKSR